MSPSSRKRSVLWTVALATFVSLVVPLAGPARASHDDRALDVEPETALREVGTEHTLTATVCNPTLDPGPPPTTVCPPEAASNDDGGPINVDFENENGVNDDDGVTPVFPDGECTIPVGESSCEFKYIGTVAGTDRWRAWIDDDGDGEAEGATVEADSDEPRDESQDAASTGTNCPGAASEADGSLNGEPDCTDVVSVSWTGDSPQTLDCDDESGPDTEHQVNPADEGPPSNETYSCYVKDLEGDPTGDFDAAQDGLQDTYVYGEVENGVNDPDDPDAASYNSPDYSCLVGTGDPSPVGECEITVTQAELEEGTATICFWVDDSTPSDGATLCASETPNEHPADTGANTTGNDLADEVAKTWAERSAAGGGLDAEPETGQRTVGDTHVITATVYDQFGDPFQGDTTVHFERFNGSISDQDGGSFPGDSDRQCTTVNSPTCSIDYTSNQPGRDLWCVWIGATPGMDGNEANGTCGGESQEDPDDTPGSPDAAQPTNDDIDVVAVTWRNVDPASHLRCEPEQTKVRRGRTHTVVCQALAGMNGIPGTEIDVEIVGKNDPDSSGSPQTPDRTCRTNGDGMCSFRHSTSRSGELGLTRYRAWVDSDYFNPTEEADQGEERAEGSPNGAGATPEPDTTEVVAVRWTANPARTISLSASRTRQRLGRGVTLKGNVVGDPECEEGHLVRIRVRPAASTGSFRTLRTTTTNGLGHYEVRVVVRRSRDYRAVVAPTSSPACRFAKSRIITVRAT